MLHTSLITFAQVLSNREFCSVCVKTFSAKDNETKKRKEKVPKVPSEIRLIIGSLLILQLKSTSCSCFLVKCSCSLTIIICLLMHGVDMQ